MTKDRLSVSLSGVVSARPGFSTLLRFRSFGSHSNFYFEARRARRDQSSGFVAFTSNVNNLFNITQNNERRRKLRGADIKLQTE